MANALNLDGDKNVPVQEGSDCKAVLLQAEKSETVSKVLLASGEAFESASVHAGYWPMRALEKMHKNSIKAVLEHQDAKLKALQENIAMLEGELEQLRLKPAPDQEEIEQYVTSLEQYREERDVFLTAEEAVPPLAYLQKQSVKPPLAFSHSVFEAQGKRGSMEDAHFYVETEKAVLTALFDGHGGVQVSSYAAAEYQKRFADTLIRADGNVHQAMQMLINEIQSEILEHKDWDRVGSTAVICYVDKQTNLIYTATLGDSEAHIYRDDKAIPLSCVRDWHTEKDAKRFADVNGKPELQQFLMRSNPKELRFPFPVWGCNVARAFGDAQLRVLNERPGIIHKSKITVNELKPGDTLVLACDGVKDFTNETGIIWSLENHEESMTDAEAIGEYSLETSNDNVTAVVVHANLS